MAARFSKIDPDNLTGKDDPDNLIGKDDPDNLTGEERSRSPSIKLQKNGEKFDLCNYMFQVRSRLCALRS